MGYQDLLKDQLNTLAVVPVVPLSTQRRQALLAGLVAFLFVALAIIVSYSKKHFVLKLTLFTLLSIIGSILLAMASIFTSNSFGVYI